jgi:hypothetical protein
MFRAREPSRCWSFSRAPGQPLCARIRAGNQRLQPHGSSGILGFNWGIDPASPDQVHEAQSGLAHRPPWVDHDALADSVVDHRANLSFL